MQRGRGEVRGYFLRGGGGRVTCYLYGGVIIPTIPVWAYYPGVDVLFPLTRPDDPSSHPPSGLLTGEEDVWLPRA